MSGDISSRLDDRMRVEGTDGDTRQQRSEEEEILRADDNLDRGQSRTTKSTQRRDKHRKKSKTYHIVVRSVERVQQTCSSPSASENHKSLLFGVKG